MVTENKMGSEGNLKYEREIYNVFNSIKGSSMRINNVRKNDDTFKYKLLENLSELLNYKKDSIGYKKLEILVNHSSSFNAYYSAFYRKLYDQERFTGLYFKLLNIDKMNNENKVDKLKFTTAKAILLNEKSLTFDGVRYNFKLRKNTKLKYIYKLSSPLGEDDGFLYIFNAESGIRSCEIVLNRKEFDWV